jgi:AcrR family transcriptional regulator
MTEIQKQLIDKGVELARANGLLNVSVRSVCEACGVPVGSFPGRTGWTHKQFINILRDNGAPIGNESQLCKVMPDVRREQLLDAALRLAKKKGLYSLSHKEVAKECGVARPTVAHYFSRLDDLRIYTAQHAVKHGVVSVIVEGVIMRFLDREKLDADTLRKIEGYVVGGA